MQKHRNKTKYTTTKNAIIHLNEKKSTISLGRKWSNPISFWTANMLFISVL